MYVTKRKKDFRIELALNNLGLKKRPLTLSNFDSCYHHIISRCILFKLIVSS